MINTIACLLKTSREYDLEYVERLMKCLRENINRSTKVDFVCLSDDERVSRHCEYIKLPDSDYQGFWNKIHLFSCPDLKDRNVMYFDLDTLITKDISDILQYNFSTFTMLKGFFSGNPASGVMAWSGDYSYIAEEYDSTNNHLYNDIKSFGDQGYIAKVLRENPLYFQYLFPGRFASYKLHHSAKYDASVVCFHGKPRPRDVNWSLSL